MSKLPFPELDTQSAVSKMYWILYFDFTTVIYCILRENPKYCRHQKGPLVVLKGSFFPPPFSFHSSTNPLCGYKHILQLMSDCLLSPLLQTDVFETLFLPRNWQLHFQFHYEIHVKMFWSMFCFQHLRCQTTKDVSWKKQSIKGTLEIHRTCIILSLLIDF